MSSETIAVTVIGGYLGAGKTTLVNHLLRTADVPIAVLVNDFGEINIDADLIQATDGDTITLANGCICCSLVDGFAVALDTITSAPTRPSRLMIEASGVADPATVAAWAHRPGLRLDATLVVVDLETIERRLTDEYVGDTVKQQLAGADLLIGNKRDLIDDRDLPRAHAAIRAVTNAPIVIATAGSVDASVAFDHYESTGERAKPAVVEERHETWHLTWDQPLERSEFDALIESLEPATVRLKGIVRFADDPQTRVIVQRVGQRLTLETDGAWRGGMSKVVGINVLVDQPTGGPT